MDTQEFNFQQEIRLGTEDLLLNCENKEKESAHPNTEKNSRDLEISVQDACFDSHGFIGEEISIKVEQVEAQSTFEGVDCAYNLHIGEHFVKPEFALPEELSIKVENQEENQLYIEESQNEVNFSLNTYVKSEPTTFKSEADEPVTRLQHSKFGDDTINKESFDDTKFLIQGELDIKCEDGGNDLYSTRSPMGQVKQPHHPNKTATNNRRFRSTEPSVFKCLDCTYQTHQKQYIARHVLNHMEKTLGCAHCSYKTRNKWLFRQHQVIHAPKEQVKLHQCPECSYTSIRKSGIIHHITAKHKKPDDVTWQCTLCCYKSHWKSSLTRHLQHIHGPKDIQLIQCSKDGCLFKTSSKSYLETHIKTVHECKRLFTCSKCSFQTKYANSLKMHKRGHDDRNKWFSCTVCPHKTTSANYLKQHALVHKNDNEIQWFHCSQCPFKSKYVSSLHKHILIHNLNPEKILKCSKCSFKTVHARNFRAHQTVHKKPEEISQWFYCYLCPLRTPYKRGLASHIQKMHRDTKGRINGRTNVK